ncbi:MAG TPA: 30S ribosomal protein S2 [Candidatus Saccharimonadales bacterium]|nr:30S ribosomal protein S2 [Candidatus Saccharimonadales bacterium]
MYRVGLLGFPIEEKGQNYMASVDVDIKKLLEAGAHFGHKTERWHPKMAQYIHSKRGGSHIIDLVKTVEGLNVGLDFLSKTVADGKQVLFVGTKRQAQDIVKKLAEDTKMPFITNRWLGGMLTNWATIGGRVKYLQDLENRMASGELANKYNKLEVQRYQEQIDQLNELYGGVKELNARPGAMVVFDIVHDATAVAEARKLKVPIVALVDTNADPSLVTYPIPCNDDAIKTIQLVADYMKQAIEQGRSKVKSTATEKEDK